MTKSPTWLLEHKKNVHSQFGEDGIFEKILEALPENERWCVEFGAWDGLFLSNTRNLIENHDYSAVLIEANPIKFKELQANYADNDKVFLFNQLVGFETDDNLSHVLEKTSIPRNFELLSIDIDGNDYHVWKECRSFQPKVVCIEFNSTIPSEVEFVQAPDPNVQQGASILSLAKLGREKGYELLCVLECNMIFVLERFYPLYDIRDNSIQSLRTDIGNVTFLFSGYDGRVFLRGARELPWHGLDLKEGSFQRLPRYLRTFPATYGRFQLVSFGLYLLFRSPRTLAATLRRLDVDSLPKQYPFLRKLAEFLQRLLGKTE